MYAAIVFAHALDKYFSFVVQLQLAVRPQDTESRLGCAACRFEFFSLRASCLVCSILTKLSAQVIVLLHCCCKEGMNLKVFAAVLLLVAICAGTTAALCKQGRV